jgi:hypothetical protein
MQGGLSQGLGRRARKQQRMHARIRRRPRRGRPRLWRLHSAYRQGAQADPVGSYLLLLLFLLFFLLLLFLTLLLAFIPLV